MKKTKVNKAHYTLKGKMVEFVGWDLPVQYSGINEEHNAVRTTGGIFDVSHMGEIRFKGPQALDAVQYITSNNAAKLKPGKIHYIGGISYQHRQLLDGSGEPNRDSDCAQVRADL